MDVTLGLLADYANVTAEGKLNIMGVFQIIHAPQFPCIHGQMNLVMTLEAHRSEAGKKKQIEIRLLNEDGATLFSVGGDMEVPKLPNDPHLGTLPISVNHVLGFQNVRFEKPGTYEFVVHVGGEHKKSILLRVFELKPQHGMPG